MFWTDYWNALTGRQRTGLLAGIAMIMIAAASLAMWLLRDPEVPLSTNLNAGQLSELRKALDAAGVIHRVGDAADTLLVPQSQLGKARAATLDGQVGLPPSVGLELFKDTDFSSTDFAQKINYQRALQGELTRTIQSVAGVRTARVHVILPDGGLLKRHASKASAALTIAVHPGTTLSRAQVGGLQRLVAASVPEVKADDVVVLDESGTSLARAGGEAEGDLSSAQLDLKRQADQYLESKLSRLLSELVPHGTASLSVDTTLDHTQLRVTTEQPMAALAPPVGEHPAGVLVKERQSQRGKGSGTLQVAGDTSDENSTDWESEYKVGQRVEQALSAPGSIKRISVAVALQNAPADLGSAAVEQLVGHAVGINRARGDSVMVVLLAAPAGAPGGQVDGLPGPTPATRAASEPVRVPPAPAWPGHTAALLAIFMLIVCVVLAASLLLRRRRKRPGAAEDGTPVDADALAARIRTWLDEGGSHGRA